jgi:hypothetical protein
MSPFVSRPSPSSPAPGYRDPAHRFARAPPLTHLRRLRARAGFWGLEEKGQCWGRWGWGRGSPTLARMAQCGGSRVTEAAAARPKPGPGCSAAVVAPSPSAASPKEGPAPQLDPPLLQSPPSLPNNFRSQYQATGGWAEHRASPNRGDCWGIKKKRERS